MADFFSVEDLDNAFGKMREAVARAKALAIPHDQFIAENCRSSN